MPELQSSPTTNRHRTVRLLTAALLVVIAAVCVGIGLYWITLNSQSAEETAGDPGASDRVSVMSTVERIDAPRYTASVRIWVIPRGSFTSDGGDTANRDIEVLATGINEGNLSLTGGRRIASKTVTVELHDGEITNYPFDRYTGELYVAAMRDGKNIPVELVVENDDAFFTLSATADSDSTEPGLELQFTRSISTKFMVALMFVVMWSLALSVAAAAVIVVRKELGLLWNAMSWMAATLFALTVFRGTAPGSPPFGCLLDYTAFLWAEAVVACSLTYVVVHGVLHESRK
jgi:hypothetical protein